MDENLQDTVRPTADSGDIIAPIGISDSNTDPGAPDGPPAEAASLAPSVAPDPAASNAAEEKLGEEIESAGAAPDAAMKPPALDALQGDRVASKPDDSTVAGFTDLTPDEQIAQRTAEVQRRAAQESAQAAILRARVSDVPEDEQKAPVVALADGTTSNGEGAETLAKREQRANALMLLDERLTDLKNHRFNMKKSFDTDLEAIDLVIQTVQKERDEIAAADLPFGTAEVGAADRKLHEAAIDPLQPGPRPVVREMAPYQ